MRQKFFLNLIVCSLLAACLPFEVMHLRAETADAVMEAIRASDPTADFADAFTLSCTVSEGNFCDIVLPQLAQTALARPLSQQVNQDVGPKYVEHSTRNTVQIRCEQPATGLTRQWKCEIDRGGGWQTLPVP